MSKYTRFFPNFTKPDGLANILVNLCKCTNKEIPKIQNLNIVLNEYNNFSHIESETSFPVNIKKDLYKEIYNNMGNKNIYYSLKITCEEIMKNEYEPLLKDDINRFVSKISNMEESKNKNDLLKKISEYDNPYIYSKKSIYKLPNECDIYNI